MKPKKVLSLHWGFSVGGVAKYAATIEQIQDISRISISSAIILDLQRQVDWETMKSLRRRQVFLRTPRVSPGWWREVVQYVRTFDPDLLLTHGFNGHFVSYLLHKRGAIQAPAICSYHGEYHATTTLRRGLGRCYNGFTEYYIRTVAVAVVAVAEYCRNILVRAGIEPSKIEVIHNGLSPISGVVGSPQRLRAEWGVRDGELVVGVASRLDPVKGIGYVIDAVAELCSRCANVRLVIVGTGTEEEALRARVQASGLGDRVVFTGFRADVPSCMAAFDVFVLPSLAEYHSIGLLEAMRAGLPTVATDVGGNTESVRDGKEALIVWPGDAEAFVKALGRLLGDGALRENLGRRARQRFLEAFTEERMLKRTAEWLEAIAVR